MFLLDLRNSTVERVPELLGLSFSVSSKRPRGVAGEGGGEGFNESAGGLCEARGKAMGVATLK